MSPPIAGIASRVTALDRLLEVEARLEARLDAARREGEARVAEAEGSVNDHHAALDAELEAARAASTLRLTTEVGERIRVLGAERDSALERLDRVGRERLEELATWLAGEVVAGIEREDQR